MSSSSNTSITDIYHDAVLEKDIALSAGALGGNIKDILQQKIAQEIEGKCITEGFVKPNSVKLLQYSMGVVEMNCVVFRASFECKICLPVEGMQCQCVVKDVTKAGIRAISALHEPTPIVVFISRDHYHMNKKFSDIKATDTIIISVIGNRFELNDAYISVIAEIVSSSKHKLTIDE